MWSPTLGALTGQCEGCSERPGPGSSATPSHTDPCHPVHGESLSSLQGVHRQSDSFPTRDVRVGRGMQHGLEHLRETLRMLGATADRCSAAQRQPPPIPGSRAHPKIDHRVVQLKLIDSTNTCYLNSMVLAWAHATTCVGCSEQDAYATKIQAWRDVLRLRRPAHVDALASWRSVLAGW